MRPHESSSYFTARDGKIKSLKIPVTDIAPEEARGDSLKDALVIYRHFCEILTSRYGKPKRRKNRNGFYEALYVSPQGVGINPGGCRSFVECYIKSPEEMFIESEYARLVAKGYISEDEEPRWVVSAPGRGWPRAYCRGSLVLGLLLGLVVSHPVRGSVGVVGADLAIKAL